MHRCTVGARGGERGGARNTGSSRNLPHSALVRAGVRCRLPCWTAGRRVVAPCAGQCFSCTSPGIPCPYRCSSSRSPSLAAGHCAQQRGLDLLHLHVPALIELQSFVLCCVAGHRLQHCGQHCPHEAGQALQDCAHLPARRCAPPPCPACPPACPPRPATSATPRSVSLSLLLPLLTHLFARFCARLPAADFPNPAASVNENLCILGYGSTTGKPGSGLAVQLMNGNQRRLGQDSCDKARAQAERAQRARHAAAPAC